MEGTPDELGRLEDLHWSVQPEVLRADLHRIFTVRRAIAQVTVVAYEPVG